MMKLYFYSDTLLTFVESKRVTAKFAAGGILIGTMLLFGVARLNQFAETAIGPRSAKALTYENDVLRQQINLISSRVGKMEQKAEEQKDRTDGLHKLLRHRKNIRDEVASSTNGPRRSNGQTMVAATKGPRP